jgi:hypothetical protein
VSGLVGQKSPQNPRKCFAVTHFAVTHGPVP